TFENRPPLSARGSRPFEPMADRTHNQVLDDGLDRSRDFFTAVPMTNLIDGFFHRAPRSKIRRDEAGIVQVIMTRNGSGECRTAMGSEAGELSFVATAAEPASLGGETIGHGDAVAVRMRDRQPAIVTIETFEAASLQQPDAVTHIVADAVTGLDERFSQIRVEQGGKAMRLMVVGKKNGNARPKRLIAKKLFRFKKGRRIRGAATLAQHRQFALAQIFAKRAAQNTVKFLAEIIPNISDRKKAPRRRNRIDVEAAPAGTLQYFIDRDPRQAARACFSRCSLLLHSRDAIVIFKYRGGGIVRAGVKCEYTHGLVVCLLGLCRPATDCSRRVGGKHLGNAVDQLLDHCLVVAFAHDANNRFRPGWTNHQPALAVEPVLGVGD